MYQRPGVVWLNTLKVEQKWSLHNLLSCVVQIRQAYLNSNNCRICFQLLFPTLDLWIQGLRFASSQLLDDILIQITRWMMYVAISEISLQSSPHQEQSSDQIWAPVGRDRLSTRNVLPYLHLQVNQLQTSLLYPTIK